MRQLIVAMLGALSLAVVPFRSTLAQDEPIEYGSASALGGVTHIFVDTGEDMDDRENIIRIITRELRGVAVVGRARDAGVIMYFRSSEATFYAGSYASNRTTTDATVHQTGPRSATGTATKTSSEYSVPVYHTVSAGSGRVFKLNDEGNVLMIMSFKGSKPKGSIWKKPRTRFAQKFVDMYREANPDARKR